MTTAKVCRSHIVTAHHMTICPCIVQRRYSGHTARGRHFDGKLASGVVNESDDGVKVCLILRGSSSPAIKEIHRYSYQSEGQPCELVGPDT